MARIECWDCGKVVEEEDPEKLMVLLKRWRCWLGRDEKQKFQLCELCSVIIEQAVFSRLLHKNQVCNKPGVLRRFWTWFFSG